MKTKTRKQSKPVKKTVKRTKTVAPRTPATPEPAPLSNEEMQRIEREAVGN